jgi:hypothetical protein
MQPLHHQRGIGTGQRLLQQGPSSRASFIKLTNTRFTTSSLPKISIRLVRVGQANLAGQGARPSICCSEDVRTGTGLKNALVTMVTSIALTLMFQSMSSLTPT